MNRTLAFTFLALVSALALGTTAAIAETARHSSDPGVTSNSILLGGTAPLTGLASQYAPIARGADAYFKYVNSKGGVNGRMITYTYRDDAYSPPQSVVVTRQLVEQDKVFAVFNSLGTTNNILVRPYLNEAKVPQLFVASGATTWGRDYAEFPYTIGFQPSYQAEGWVYGKYLARTAPGARVAVLFQDDEYGKDLLGGLKRGLQRSGAKVIAAQPYSSKSADVSSQIATLKASGADTLAIFAIPTFAIQAYKEAQKLGWKPKRLIDNNVAAASSVMQVAAAEGREKLVDGTISIAFLKDPTDSQFKNDAAIKLYRKILARYDSSADANDPLYLYGMAVAWTAVNALTKAGKDLTRASLVKVLDTFNASGNPFLLPGIAIKTAGADHYPIEQMVLRRWQNGAWHLFGGLWGYRAS
jgi:branched-chain amino acid transport system substrate-binding protein